MTQTRLIKLENYFQEYSMNDVSPTFQFASLEFKIVVKWTAVKEIEMSSNVGKKNKMTNAVRTENLLRNSVYNTQRKTSNIIMYC